MAKHFSKSRIVAKKIPETRKPYNKRGAVTKHLETPYKTKAAELRATLLTRTKDHEKISTVMAFARNYFVEYGEVPTLQQLLTPFPYLRKNRPKKQ